MSRHPSSPTLPPVQVVAEKVFTALERFLRVEAVSGVVLLAAAATALGWANSPAAASYQHFWHASLSVAFGDLLVSQPLHFWINDGLMTIFFLVVGMEIRREIHAGALATPRLAALPLAAALGGVLAPALIYAALNAGAGGEALRGWAVPTATDIAFAVGVLALLGRSIPGGVRIFLLALAIIDDIAAVVIIALFYSGGLDVFGFVVAAAGLLLVLGLQQIAVRSAWAYVLPGAVVWYGLLHAGVHPTLAGVALGLMTPVPSLRGVQMALHPWVAYGIMPLFALANAGVNLADVDFRADDAQGIAFGVAVALVLGKPCGIVLCSWGAVRAGWCRLPPDVSWRGVLLVGCLGGIGFTMSIFIATLAFADPTLLAAAKSGVLLASFTAGVVGYSLGRAFARRSRDAAVVLEPAAERRD